MTRPRTTGVQRTASKPAIGTEPIALGAVVDASPDTRPAEEYQQVMVTYDRLVAARPSNGAGPRRRLYRITLRGEQAAASAATSDTPHRVPVGRLGLEPT